MVSKAAPTSDVDFYSTIVEHLAQQQEAICSLLILGKRHQNDVERLFRQLDGFEGRLVAALKEGVAKCAFESWQQSAVEQGKTLESRPEDVAGQNASASLRPNDMLPHHKDSHHVPNVSNHNSFGLAFTGPGYQPNRATTDAVNVAGGAKQRGKVPEELERVGNPWDIQEGKSLRSDACFTQEIPKGEGASLPAALPNGGAGLHKCFEIAYPMAEGGTDESSVGIDFSKLTRAQFAKEKQSMNLGSALITDPDEKKLSDVEICGRKVNVMRLLEPTSLILIATNLVFTGMQINANMEEVRAGTPAPRIFKSIDLGFTVAFAIELVTKLWLFKKRFWFGPDRLWNFLDFLLVASSLADMLTFFVDASVMRALRMLRIMRAFRGIRGMRSIRNLRLMVAAIQASFASLVWGVLLLVFMMFMFALGIMQSLLMINQSGVTIPSSTFEHYGTLAISIETLFKAVSGGNDWGDLAEPLVEVSPFFTQVYMFYIVVVVMGVMNVITAVFCENACHVAGVDAELVISEEMVRAKGDMVALMNLLHTADTDGDSFISKPEMETFFGTPEKRAMMHLLSIDVSEARGLFDLLDADCAGQVNINEFADTIIRLKGAAKGCDTAMLLFETKRLMMRLASFMCFTTDSFQVLFEELHLSNHGVCLENYMSPEFIHRKEAETKTAIKCGLTSQLGRGARSADVVTVSGRVSCKNAA